MYACSPRLRPDASRIQAAGSSSQRSWKPGAGRALRGVLLLLLDAGVDLFAVHLHLGRRLDSQLDLPRADLEHGDFHGIADPDVLS